MFVETAVAEPAMVDPCEPARVNLLLIRLNIIEPVVRPVMVDDAGVVLTTTGIAMVEPEMIVVMRVDAVMVRSAMVVEGVITILQLLLLLHEFTPQTSHLFVFLWL